MNGLPHDFSLSGRADSCAPYTFWDVTLQKAQHVEELTRSRMQPVAVFTLRRSLPCSRVHPVAEFPLRKILQAQEFTPLLSSPCAGVYPVEECTPLLSFPNVQEFTLRADSHLTVDSAQEYTPLLSSPCARVYPVEECTPLLSLPMRKSLLRAQTHSSQFTTFSGVHRFNACPCL